MKHIKRIFAVLLGFVFFGAGFLKLMDPVGAGLVVGEYCKFLHLGFLAPASGVLGVAMALLEAVTGVVLITGAFPVLAAAVSGIMLLFFTVLTFVMWRVNPAMDCGCFGEAIHLTHLQSFLKNVVLCVLWAAAFLPFRSIRKPRKIKYVSTAIALLSLVAFTVWSLLSVPQIDFTPFAPGAVLAQAQEVPDADAPLLSISDSDGDYCDELLASGTLLVISAYDPDLLSDKAVERLYNCAAAAADADVRPIFIAAGDSDAAEGSGAATFSADRRELMTLNRSNGGATLLQDGMIVAKWPSRALPDTDKIAVLASMDPAEAMVKENTPKRLKLQGFLLYVFAVVLLL